MLKLLMDDLYTPVHVAFSVHGACTQDIRSWESQSKVYQLKVNPKHSITSIHQEISLAKEE